MTTEQENDVKDETKQLYPEDQARVDRYLSSGYNTTERKPFKPLLLLVVLVVVVWAIGYGASLITGAAGIY